MAVQLPRNAAELQKFFTSLQIPKAAQPLAEGVRELQIAAGEKSRQVLEAQKPSTLRERISAREVSPELRKREREVISELFAAPEEIRKRFEGLPIDPTRVSAAVAGRMNNYLVLLDSIRDQRKVRENRIDDIIQSVESIKKTELQRLELELKQTQREADNAWDTFTFAINRIDKNKKSSQRKAQELTEFEIRAGVTAFDDVETVNAKKRIHISRKDKAPKGMDADIFAQNVREDIQSAFNEAGGQISIDPSLIARNLSMALVELRDTVKDEVLNQGMVNYDDIYRYVVDTRGEQVDDATLRDLSDYVFDIVNKGIQGRIPANVWDEMDDDTRQSFIAQGYIRQE